MRTYSPVLPPYVHQVRALDLLKDKSEFALFMGMRTGKSKTILDEWGQLYVDRKVLNLLVVAPAGVYRVWETEIEKHVPEEIKAAMKVSTWVSGGTAKQKSDVVSLSAHLGPTVLLVNVEALSYDDAALNACINYVKSADTMLVVDESTTIKNHASRRTLAACALGPLAKYRRILSGLPTPRSPLDAFSQMWFLDPQILGFNNYYAFRARYAVMKRIKVGHHHANIVVGYRNLEELYEKIKPHAFRVRLDECADVPPKLYQFRYVELTAEQHRMYADIKQRATTKLLSGEYVTATEVVTQILRLHQLCCGHLVDEDGTIHDVPTNRVKSLMDLLEEYDGKAVVWCSYDHDVRAIAAELRQEYGGEAVACFWGGNRDVREEDDRRFQQDPECRFMVATPGAGGRGRKWSVAKLLIYYSNTDNLEHRDQSEERASAIDQVDNVTVVDLITRDTVEIRIVKSLRKKIDMAAVITGDNWREWLI